MTMTTEVNRSPQRTVNVKILIPKKLNFWERIYLVEIVRGLWITGGHFVTNMGTHLANAIIRRNNRQKGETVTIQYPEEKRPYSPRLRARHRIMRREDGSPRCVACMMCETACPDHCIEIVAEESEDPTVEKRPKSFEIDILRCCFCGLCVKACPEDAIRMDTEVLEMAEPYREILYDRESLTLLGDKHETTRKGMGVPAE